jgi:very-short-patch-repair endonuclease
MNEDIQWVGPCRTKCSYIKRELAKQFRKSMTPSEKLIWNKLRDRRLLGYRFRRQQVILGFIVDFYCHELKFVIEIDGQIHKQQKDYDHEREMILLKNNISVLRITNREVETQMPSVIDTISSKIARIAK